MPGLTRFRAFLSCADAPRSGQAKPVEGPRCGQFQGTCLNFDRFQVWPAPWPSGLTSGQRTIQRDRAGTGAAVTGSLCCALRIVLFRIAEEGGSRRSGANAGGLATLRLKRCFHGSLARPAIPSLDAQEAFLPQAGATSGGAVQHGANRAEQAGRAHHPPTASQLPAFRIAARGLARSGRGRQHA